MEMTKEDWDAEQRLVEYIAQGKDELEGCFWCGSYVHFSQECPEQPNPKIVCTAVEEGYIR